MIILTTASYAENRLECRQGRMCVFQCVRKRMLLRVEGGDVGGGGVIMLDGLFLLGDAH